MKVKNKEMYHFHRSNEYDDMWKVGNEILVDDSFESHYHKNLYDVNTAVICNNGELNSIRNFIKKIIESVSNEEKALKLKNLSEEEFLKKAYILYRTLKDTEKKLCGYELKAREESLEEIRIQEYPNLISRFHSIWVCDKEQLDFWKENIKSNEKRNLYKLLLTGELFKSSDKFIPYGYKSKQERLEEARKYWNPIFETEEEEKRAEYLFQGKVKILEKVN